MIRRFGPGLVLAVIFAGLSLAIGSGVLTPLDRSILLAMHRGGDTAGPLGPAWLAEAGRDITGLGSNAVMGLIVAIAGGYLAFAAHRKQAFTLVATFASAQLLCAALKLVAQRPRPDLVADGPRVFTTSFPSSHSMISAATLFALAAIAADFMPTPWRRRYVYGAALVGTVLVGLSRIYLGVHWPSDVGAGWTAGLFCAWAWHVASRPDHRKPL